jgi:Zn-dependent protease
MAGRMLGIPLKVSYGWFFIFAVLSTSLALIYFPGQVNGLASIYKWLAGILVSLLVFASVILHEAGHSLVARRYGVTIERIELFLLGGLSMMQQEPEDATAELWVAMAGPLSSLALAGGLNLLIRIVMSRPVAEIIPAALIYLFLVNLLLGVFNLLPGFPMDGGRVLKSVIWGLTGSKDKAIGISLSVGAILSRGLILGGLLLIIVGVWAGAWLVPVGWLLHISAKMENECLGGGIKSGR